MAEQQETADEDIVMLPATFDFETTFAGDSSSDDDDYQPMPEADMGHASEVEVDPESLPNVEMDQLPLDHKSHDVKDENMANGGEVVKKPGGRLEVVIRSLPPHVRSEYIPIRPGFEVYKVLGQIPSLSGESWWSIEYEDGTLDQVAFDDLLDLPNGDKAFNLYERGMDFDFGGGDLEMGFNNKPRKRKSQGDSDYEIGLVSDIDDEMMPEEDADEGVITSKRRRLVQGTKDVPARRSLRNSSRMTSTLRQDASSMESNTSHNGRKLRARKSISLQKSRPLHDEDEDADELAQSDDDDPFDIVRSDLQPINKSTKRKKRLTRNKPASKTHRGSSVEYEPVRRSGRTTKTTKNMKDPLMDEELYADDDKVPTAPKIISIKEVFEPLNDSDFKDVHCDTCDTCGGDSLAGGKGPLIPCQGCSLMYHKVCLGYRSAREHFVTKVGPEYFVLQCRHCTLFHKKRDLNSPNLDTCLSCKTQGPACKPFAPKKTPKQEEKERIANNGVDPAYPVSPNLINNAKNVLFRCTSCKCAYHFEHLPSPSYQEGDIVSDNIRSERLKEYSIEWKCKDCLDMREKVQVLVAWRPVDRTTYTPDKTWNDLVEDAKEYLIKWENKSYFHCVWKPGPWVWGVTAAAMRTTFPKRNEGENLLPKWDEKNAIPEEYLLADVILNVKYNGQIRARTKEEEFQKISDIRKVRVKFQGLAYDDVVWDSPPPRDSGVIWKSFEAAFYEFLNGKYFKTESAIKIKERIDSFRAVENFEEHIALKKHPERLGGLLRGDLMDYQVDGVDWLLYSFHQGVSAVLADEMGLGKTVQVIALITFLVQRNPKCWPFLIVVPNSTCPNWRRELKKWAPDLRVVTYHGGKKPQQLAYDHELFPDGVRDMRAHVVVMSYDSAQDERTKPLFKNVSWAGLVVDEGQRLKNDQNLLYLALRAMKIPFRLLLTGTPLQNNKRELFNLLQFIDSSKNAAQLDEEYQEITAENLPVLHKMLRPYFLRRTKAQVLHFLPPMAQIIVPVTMSVVQEKLCKSIMAKNPDLIRAIFANSKMKATERGSLNNILMQLRKCLCHPFMYSGAIEDKSTSPEVMFRNLIEASSKLVLLEIMLPKLKERGHRVLIFSQFLDQLDIIEDFLSGLEYSYRRLDGNISSLEKQKRIDAYNEPGSDIFAFLLSTRAGGVGINLATADTVIILDPDFNPHQDIQALSRAHRIGQKNKVLCFQLMTKSSVEEKIMQIGRKKMALDHILIETMDDQDDAGNDLESILKHGAEALFSENQKDVIKYDSASVDKLLDRSQIEATATGEDESAETQFSLARVWANEKGELTDDIEADTEAEAINSSLWENILKEREEVARREAELNKEILGRGGRRRRAVQYTGPNYGLEDGMPARGEDGGSDADADFVNNDMASDGENSDEGSAGKVLPEEVQDVATTELANSRKSQGKAAKKAQLAIASEPPKAQNHIPVYRPKGPKGPSDARPQNLEPRIPGNGSKQGPEVEYISSRPVQRPTTAHAMPSYNNGNSFSERGTLMRGPLPYDAPPYSSPQGPFLQHMSLRPPDQSVTNQHNQWLSSAPAPYDAPWGFSTPTGTQQRLGGQAAGQPGHANGVIAPIPSSAVLSSNMIPRDGVAQPGNICQECFTQHTSPDCPEINLNSEISLRLALDALRAPSAGNKALFEAKKRFLASKLRQIVQRAYESAAEGLSSNQDST